MKTETERQMPMSVDSEKSVLGAVLLDNSAILQAAEILEPEHFGLDSHRRIFGAMLRMQSAGTPIDFVTLSVELERSRELDLVGGSSYVTSLTDGLPRISNIEHYCNTVREKSLLRGTINLAQQLQARAYEAGEKAEEILGDAHEFILRALNNSGNFKTKHLLEFADETLRSIEERAKKSDGLLGFSFGLPAVDDATGGIRQDEIAFIGARTGDGKTAWVLQMVVENARRMADLEDGDWRKGSVGIFSLELRNTRVLERLISQNDKYITASMIRSGRFPQEVNSAHLRRTALRVAELPIVVNDQPYMNITQFEVLARQMILRHNVKLIILDHVHEMRAKSRDMRDMFTQIGEGIRQFARTTGVPIVALCQILVDTTNVNRPPQKEHLKEARALAEKASFVCFLQRGRDESEYKKFTGDDWFIVSKGRDCEDNMWFPVRYDRDHLRFEERAL